MMIKKLLKKHKYPPEGMDDAVQTVMEQCELWTDTNDMDGREKELSKGQSMRNGMYVEPSSYFNAAMLKAAEKWESENRDKND